MEIGFIGLGRMGANMVERLLLGGHRVVAYNRSPDKTRLAAQQGAVPSFSLEELVSNLKDEPKAVWTMVPAGDPTEHEIQSLTPLLKRGDIIIDGGNSNFRDSIARARRLAEHYIHFLDVGTSGGIWGLKNGYCMMIGGERDIFEHMRPIFSTLAPNENGYDWFGPSGAGHFTKMVHNGIEYGMLEAYGEGFEIIERSQYKVDLRRLSQVWNNGSVVRSWLLELAELAFEQDGNDLAEVAGYVEDSGEGRWTVVESIGTATPAPIIALSLMARFYSRQDESYSAKVIAALRNQFGGHAIRTTEAVEAETAGKAIQSTAPTVPTPSGGSVAPTSGGASEAITHAAHSAETTAEQTGDTTQAIKQAQSNVKDIYHEDGKRQQ